MNIFRKEIFSCMLRRCKKEFRYVIYLDSVVFFWHSPIKTPRTCFYMANRNA